MSANQYVDENGRCLHMCESPGCLARCSYEHPACACVEHRATRMRSDMPVELHELPEPLRAFLWAHRFDNTPGDNTARVNALAADALAFLIEEAYGVER